MHLKTNIRYILLCALRDRLFVGLIVGVVIASLLAAFFGSAAFLENREMTLVMAASVSRFIIVLGLIVFICFQLRSHFDNKEMDVMLTRPVSRDEVVLSYFFGFAFVATLVCLPIIAIIAIIKPVSLSGYALWAVSLVFESWIVVAIALFAGMVIKSAVISVLSSLAIYILGRMMILFIMTSARIEPKIELLIGKKALQAVSVVTPRLDLFAKSEWLIYGIKQADAWIFVAAQLIICVCLLVLASILDFRKKQF